MAGDDACVPKEIPIENELWLSFQRKPMIYLADTLGAPCSELFYVAVQPGYFEERDTIQIYGTISIYDEDLTPYELYCRDSDDPQTLTPKHNLLSFDMPLKCLVSTSWSHISFSLKDKVGDALIVEKELTFGKSTDINQHNKLQQLDHSPVLVTYAAFPTAVVASLEILLIKKNDTTRVPFNLSGNIIARCGCTYGHKYPGIVLLNHVSNQPIEANDPIELDRDVVVVPAYSFLRIDIQLSQTDPHLVDINCHADFLARHNYSEHREIVVQDDFVVRFNVWWRHPYVLNNKTRQPFKPPNFVCPPPRKHFYSLAEVYTVMIHHDTNRELKIFGAMHSRDNLARFALIDIDPLNPLIISGNEKTIPPIDVPRCVYMSTYWSMGLDLEDVENQVLIKGSIGWSDLSVEKPISWFDKRICSIIPGERGYAAVFYTIFSKAVQVEVGISFKCDGYPDVGYCLDGSIVARHSNETYLTEHDKAYYQSVLFRGKSSDLKSGGTLPLLKPVVAVPSDASLTVIVNLRAKTSSHGLPPEDFNSDICFNLGCAERYNIDIDGNNCSIEVSLGCTDLDKLFAKEWDLIRKDYQKEPPPPHCRECSLLEF